MLQSGSLQFTDSESCSYTSKNLTAMFADNIQYNSIAELFHLFLQLHLPTFFNLALVDLIWDLNTNKN